MLKEIFEEIILFLKNNSYLAVYPKHMLSKLTYNFPDFFIEMRFLLYTNEPYVNDVSFWITDIKYFTYLYPENFECFLKSFHFLNTKWKMKKNFKREELTNKRKSNALWQVNYFEWPWNMLVLSVTWMFVPRRNLISGYSDLNRISNTFPASLFHSLSYNVAFFPVLSPMADSFRNILVACLLLQTFKYLSGMWNGGSDQEGKKITEIRHLKKII